MARLTRRNPDGAANFADADFESVCAELTPDNREKVSAALEKLADWEDGKEYAESVLNEGKRLTTVDEDGNVELVNEGSLPQFYLIERIGDAFEKLRAYEDAEEQGRLVRLPCAVGDTVYSVYRGDIEETKVQVITISQFGLEFQDGFQGNWVFHTDSIGKTVFLTREEAAEALKVSNA